MNAILERPIRVGMTPERRMRNAFRWGGVDRLRGRGTDENRFPMNSVLHKLWEDGFKLGRGVFHH